MYSFVYIRMLLYFGICVYVYFCVYLVYVQFCIHSDALIFWYMYVCILLCIFGICTVLYTFGGEATDSSHGSSMMPVRETQSSRMYKIQSWMYVQYQKYHIQISKVPCAGNPILLLLKSAQINLYSDIEYRIQI